MPHRHQNIQQTLIKGIIDHLQGNNSFLELELGGVPNSTTYSTNSTVELLHGRVDGAEPQKMEQNSPKHPQLSKVLVASMLTLATCD